MRVVFMGTPDFAVPCLEALIKNGHNVSLCVTKPDMPVGRKQILTPSPVKVCAIENKVNEIIGKNMPVTVEYMTKQEAAAIVDLSKLPENATDTLRIVRVGDYDACACAGTHVGNTNEIGKFKIISASFTPGAEPQEPGCWRVRFKLEQ